MWKHGKPKPHQISRVTQKTLLLNYDSLSRLLTAKEILSSLASIQKQCFFLNSSCKDLNVKTGFWGRNPGYFLRSLFFAVGLVQPFLCVYTFFFFFKLSCIFRKWYHMNMLVKLAWGFYYIYIQQKKSLSVITRKLIIGPL